MTFDPLGKGGVAQSTILLTPILYIFALSLKKEKDLL